MSRRTELRTLAAAALREGEDPLHLSFLSKHGVTLDECYDLADDMALGLDMMSEAMDLVNQGGLALQVGGQRLVDAVIRGGRSGR